MQRNTASQPLPLLPAPSPNKVTLESSLTAPEMTGPVGSADLATTAVGGPQQRGQISPELHRLVSQNL